MRCSGSGAPRLTRVEGLRHAYNVGYGGNHVERRQNACALYELLRERMQVAKEHMRAIKDGSIVEDDRLDELLTVADLDRQMLQVMRQAVAEVLAREEVSRPQAA